MAVESVRQDLREGHDDDEENLSVVLDDNDGETSSSVPSTDPPNAQRAVDENNNNESSTHSTTDHPNPPQPPAAAAVEEPIKLYKSSRLKCYITLALASYINYESAQESFNVIVSARVPSKQYQRRYATAVSLVSLVLTGAAVLVHLLDHFQTPLQKVWQAVFRPTSRMELALAGFLALWWSIGTGIQTSVTGLAGDGKGQYNLYFSTWVCLWTSFGLLDAWLIADGAEGIKAFVTSWPNRAPAWLCIMVLSMATLIWYVDLWKNHDKLDREPELFIQDNFVSVNEGLWQWMIVLTVFTFLEATGFVLVEIFRGTKVDGSIKAKGRCEKTFEGICYFSLVLAWIPTVMVATTPGGSANLPGNAYFFTWLLMIFIFEGMVWYIHDMRHDLLLELKEREDEYKKRQKKVLEETKRIQQGSTEHTRRERSRTEYYDAIDAL